MLYGKEHNAKYNAEYVTKWDYREYNPERNPDSDSTIMSYTTTMAIDDCKMYSESTPSDAVPFNIPYGGVWV